MSSLIIEQLGNGCYLVGLDDGSITGTFLTPMLCTDTKKCHGKSGCAVCHKHTSAIVKFTQWKLGLFASHAEDGSIKIWDSMFGTCMGNVDVLTEKTVDTLCFPPLF